MVSAGGSGGRPAPSGNQGLLPRPGCRLLLGGDGERVRECVQREMLLESVMTLP